MLTALTNLDRNLAADIAGEDRSGYTLHVLDYEGATVGNQHWQVLWHADYQRAGIVFVGSGSSGCTTWTEASSPEDALRRLLKDEVQN